MFGGAKGYSSSYDIKNDTYIFKTKESTWVKINPGGDIPPARAAHAACAINEEHLAIIGGAGESCELVPDEMVMIGEVIGDGQFIGFSKETGKIMWEDHGEITELPSFADFLNDTVIRMLKKS